MRLNDYFDQVYCLSLPHSSERRASMNKRAAAFDLSFGYYPGIYGSLLANVHKVFSKNTETQITSPNYMGCALAHLSIYKDALSRGRKQILVLEDDLLFHRDLNKRFEDIRPEIPQNWDLLYLSWIPLSDDLRMWDYNVITPNIITPNIVRAKNLWSCMAYGISETAMQKTLESFDFSKEIDRFFVEDIQPNYPCYGIRPQLFAGYDNLSNNTGTYDSIFQKSYDARVAGPLDYV